jgi:hypothetical protein
VEQALQEVLQRYGKDPSSYVPSEVVMDYIREQIGRQELSEAQMSDELLQARAGSAIAITHIQATVRSPQQKLRLLVELVRDCRWVCVLGRGAGRMWMCQGCARAGICVWARLQLQLPGARGREPPRSQPVRRHGQGAAALGYRGAVGVRVPRAQAPAPAEAGAAHLAPALRRQGLRGSRQFQQLQQVMAAAAAAAGPGFSWASITCLVTYCLGSVDLSPDYLRMLEATGARVPPKPLDQLGPGAARGPHCPALPPCGQPAVAPCSSRGLGRRGGRLGAWVALLTPHFAPPPPFPPPPTPAAAWFASQSLWQLALALELAAELPGLQGPPQFFDPALSPFDRRLIAAAGGKVLSEDERGARLATSPTLLYMPACPLPMYQYLLEANLRAPGPEGEGRLAGLRNVALLGTSPEYVVEHARLVGRGGGGADGQAGFAQGAAGAASAAPGSGEEVDEEEEEVEEVEDDMADAQLDLGLLEEVLRGGGVLSLEVPDIAQLHLTSVTRLTLFGCDAR